jgi:hypothetical protein
MSNSNIADKPAPKIFHERKRTLEQNILTILTGLIAAILIWVGSTLISVGKDIEKLNVQMVSLADKFATRIEIENLRLELQRIRDEQERRKLFIPGYMKPNILDRNEN